VTLHELYEKMLPPLDDELARAASEFDTLAELRSDIFDQIQTLLSDEVDSRFRTDAVDELVKASKVEPAPLVIEVRTRELLNTFFRQIEQRGIDPVAYLKMAGISGEELERTLWNEAGQSLARELVLEGVADKLAIEVTDDELRSELREGGETDEEIDAFFASSLVDRIRSDLRLRRAAERVAAEVKPISADLAEARERLWTPEKEAATGPEKKLWTPGSKDE
jgi:trigger factor